MSPELIRKEFKNKKRRTLTKSNNREIDLSVVCKWQLYELMKKRRRVIFPHIKGV
jgi:hypothetical protein